MTHMEHRNPPLDVAEAPPLPEAAVALQQRLSEKTAVIGVIGLGYVGLPLAVEYAGRGFRTLGIDLDSERVLRLNAGQNYNPDLDDALVRRLVETGCLRAADHVEGLAGADVVFICVPTPVTEHKDPDTSYIRRATEALASHLHRGQLVVLKSTTYPNTTEGLVQPILERVARERGLVLGRDYFLAFSPERIDPGNRQFTTANTPVVVGGVTAACTEVAATALAQIVAHVHRVSSPKVAEMEKLLENIFRSVNIALVNELARLCDRMGGVSVWEVIEAASTKPFGFMPFYPGPGLGGHCIPIDPYYLSWLARRYDFETSFITLSARVNEEMPFYVVEKVVEALARQGVRLAEARVLILGAAFKKNVDDTRHSPSEKVMALLCRKGVGEVAYSDPHVPVFRVPLAEGVRTFEGIALTAEAVASFDVVVLLTDHDAFPYEEIARQARYIIDTRNAFARVANPAATIKVLGGGAF
ncbi:MAG: UDP-N-acetyl-D-glucosamine dehydrogenase [Rhodothermaceae bacterium]|nr:MAG: UDP-N-acetyl-D-glucosamine dehydrogenase [Rhodothermaceae bacterium]